MSSRLKPLHSCLFIVTVRVTELNLAKNMSDNRDLSSEDFGAGYRPNSVPLAPVTGTLAPEEEAKEVAQFLKSSVTAGLCDLFNENVAAKIWRVAVAYTEENVGVRSVISVSANMLTTSLTAEPGHLSGVCPPARRSSRQIPL